MAGNESIKDKERFHFVGEDDPIKLDGTTIDKSALRVLGDVDRINFVETLKLGEGGLRLWVFETREQVK